MSLDTQEPGVGWVVNASREPAAELFHYTGLAGVHGIISSRSLWATCAKHTSDLTEVSHGLELAKAEIQRLDPDVRKVLKDPGDYGRGYYLFSLSEDGDQLGQWRAYGDAGGTFAIGFQRDGLRDIDHDACIVPCTYADEENLAALRRLILDALGQVESMIASNKGGRKEPLPEHVIDELRDTNLVPFWTALGASIKHAGFSQEEEVRLLCSGQIANPRTRLRGSEIVEYLEIPELRGELREPLPLTRIIVGPTEPDRFELVRERISSLLRTNQYPPIPIELSNIPYRGR